MNHQQRAEAVVQGWLTRLAASPLYKRVYSECDCDEWTECSHKKPANKLDKSAAQENTDAIMLSELGQALDGDYGLARQTLMVIKDRILNFCQNHEPGDVDIVAKLHEIEVEEITKAFKTLNE
jgi:hypothetical protein